MPQGLDLFRSSVDLLSVQVDLDRAVQCLACNVGVEKDGGVQELWLHIQAGKPSIPHPSCCIGPVHARKLALDQKRVVSESRRERNVAESYSDVYNIDMTHLKTSFREACTLNCVVPAVVPVTG